VTKRNIGEFNVEPVFIPSCLSLSASDALRGLLSSTIELLSSKTHLLNTRRQYARSEWMDFVLLQLFNASLAELRFFKASLHVHPIEFYKVLIRLTGALNPECGLPHYEHHDLRKTFYELDAIVKKQVEQAMPSKMSFVNWMRETEFLYTASHIDTRVFQKNSFYLAVTMETPVMEWLSVFIHQIKVGARSVIESIVSSALTGVRLIHIQRPPHTLPIKAGYEYFYIEPKGAYWEQVKAERSLSLFVSQNFLQAQIELLTVEESE
jgi:type VI secretion system protein ImpJ